MTLPLAKEKVYVRKANTLRRLRFPATTNFVILCSEGPEKSAEYFDCAETSIRELSSNADIVVNVTRALQNIEEAALRVMSWCVRKR
ncbi:MAG: hypothetical protein LBD43_01380 [Holosporales bacterium]|jgi:hypothetical protein|nr:hypothetical protein [Holosporales bacterium]